MRIARLDNNLRIYRRRPIKVFAVLLTIMVFVSSLTTYDLTGAVELAAGYADGIPTEGAPPGELKDLHVNTFNLPEYMGRVVDSYSGTSGKMIIHIQDAHCNYAAQHKISDILYYLADEYGVDMIDLEGGGGSYNLSIFTGIDDAQTRERLADYFLKAGVVNGAEYFAINHPEKANLWGVEDTKLYLDNLNVYRESFRHKDDVDKALNTLTHILTNLKNKIYSADLLDMDAMREKYKSGEMGIKDYLNYLMQKAKERLIDIKGFKNIYILSQTLDLEGAINFKEANRERGLILDLLKERLSNKEMEEAALKTVEFKSDRMSPGSYYAYISKTAKSADLEVEKYPEFQKYLIYLSTYDAIDKTDVMKETESLEAAIKNTMYSNDKEKELDGLIKNLLLTKDIFDISLPKDSYEYYRNNEASFSIKNYVTFIRREAPLYKISDSLDDSIDRIDQYREHMMKFYEYSFERDKVFLKNIKFSTGGKAVLVTGGFHTENLCELFKKEGISYISIMPNFKNEEGYQSPYFGILAGGGPIKELTKSISAQLSTMQVQSPYAANAPEVVGDEEVEAVRVAVVLVRRLMDAEGKPLIVMGRDGQSFRQYELTDAGMKVTSLTAAPEGSEFIDISDLVTTVQSITDKEKPNEPRPPAKVTRKAKGQVATVVEVKVTEGRVAVNPAEAGGGFSKDEIAVRGEYEDSVALVVVDGKSAETVFATTKDAQGRTTINSPGVEIGTKENDWNGIMEATKKFEKDITEMVRRQLFYNKDMKTSDPSMINIAISEQMSGQFWQTFRGQANKVKNSLLALTYGNITCNIYIDNEAGRRELLEEIVASDIGVDKRTQRIVTFAYTNPDKSVDKRDVELEKSSYVVYLTGKEGQTATPISLCGDTGLAILNYFDRLERGDEFQIEEAIKLVARGVGSLAGMREMTIEEIVSSITEDGRLRLSGLLNIVLKPVDTNEIKAFHERELEVRKAV